MTVTLVIYRLVRGSLQTGSSCAFEQPILLPPQKPIFPQSSRQTSQESPRTSGYGPGESQNYLGAGIQETAEKTKTGKRGSSPGLLPSRKPRAGLRRPRLLFGGWQRAELQGTEPRQWHCFFSKMPKGLLESGRAFRNLLQSTFLGGASERSTSWLAAVGYLGGALTG